MMYKKHLKLYDKFVSLLIRKEKVKADIEETVKKIRELEREMGIK